jgi:Domain of unknown function (DUF397)
VFSQNNDADVLAWRKATASATGACVEVAVLGKGNGVAVRDSKDPNGPVLRYTDAEWRAFLHGARHGEFDL